MKGRGGNMEFLRKQTRTPGEKQKEIGCDESRKGNKLQNLGQIFY